MRLGVFGGTFNPPHLGHLICVQEAHWELGLDVVALIPVGEAPHKEILQDAGREARHEMCRLAAEEIEWLTASRVEIDRTGPSFTVDTLGALREESPEDDLVLIMGGDAAAELSSWHQPEQVLELATVAVVERQGADRRQVLSALSKLEVGDRMRFFSMPEIGISSTMVRQRVAADGPIRHLVPERVAAYIEASGLYGVDRELEHAQEGA